LTQRLGENPLLAGMKHCNRLEQVLARRELARTGAFEGLLVSSSGRLVSGTMTNVFLDMDGELVTPVLDASGIAGVMRSVVMREAHRCGLPLRVADLPLVKLASCRSLFLTNVRLGVLPVQQLNGRSLQVPDAITTLAREVARLER
jgi:4-amino-4-deoxychorismate lyase